MTIAAGGRAQWRNFISLFLAGAALANCGSQNLPHRSFATASDRGSDLMESHTRADRSRVLVVAHRACWRGRAENSLDAIQSCISAGVDMIEIDVRETADGKLVLMHDDTVARTTSGTGMVTELTLRQLQVLKLRPEDGQDRNVFREDTVPTLEDALLAVRGRVLVNIDAKDAIRKKALDLADKLGMLDQVIVKSPASSPDELLSNDADYLGRGHFMPIIRQENEPLSEILRRFEFLKIDAVEVIYKDQSFLTESKAAAYAADVRILVNTMWEDLSPGHSDERALADPKAHWGALIAAGVSIIQTDRPIELMQYLRRSGKQHRSGVTDHGS